MKKLIIILLIILSANIVCAQYSWVPIGAGFNRNVGTFYNDSVSNKLFVGGWFVSDSLDGGEGANGIASWDGTSWDSLNGGINFGGNVETIINYQNQIYIGGNFERSSGKINNGFTRWNGSSWDSINIAFHEFSQYGGVPCCFYQYNNLLYCTGGFDSVGNYYTHDIVAWDGNNWIPIGLPPHIRSFQSSIGPCIVFQNELYFVSNFYDSLTNTGFSFLKWDGTSWHEAGFNFGGFVYKMAVYNDELYLCGEYFSGPGWSIVKYDGTNFSSVGGGINGPVNDIKVIGNKLFAVGGFHYVGVDYSQSGGISASCIAVWDGHNWSAFSQDIFYTSNLGSQILAIAVYNNEIYVGGSFTKVNSDTINRIAKYQGWYLGENELKKKQGEVEVYPNPSSTTITLHLSSSIPIAEAHTISISDVFGRELYKEIGRGIDTKIDVSSWSTGVYFYEVKGEKESVRGKFVVQK